MSKRKWELGLMTAIVPELDLDGVCQKVAPLGIKTLELACWPQGSGADRKFAGVCHLDVVNFTAEKAAAAHAIVAKYGMTIGALGFFPNVLSTNREERAAARAHSAEVLNAASFMKVPMSTFIGRNQEGNAVANEDAFLAYWPRFIARAEEKEVTVAIENCPMKFTNDEWPAGKNLAHTLPFQQWMFYRVPSQNFGLEPDPSHWVWQEMEMDAVMPPMYKRIRLVHLKDAKRELEKRAIVGVLANPAEYHTPRLPGLGQVNWDNYFRHLEAAGYEGPMFIEIEDPDYNGSLENRLDGIAKSARFIQPYLN